MSLTAANNVRKLTVGGIDDCETLFCLQDERSQILELPRYSISSR